MGGMSRGLPDRFDAEEPDGHKVRLKVRKKKKDARVAKLAEKADDIVEAVSGQAHDAVEKAKDVLENQIDVKVAPKQKKKKRGKKVCGFGLLLSLLGGVGYLLWRRSRPVEDPWSEEYWVDLQEEVRAEAEKEQAEADQALAEVIEEVEEAIEEAERN